MNSLLRKLLMKVGMAWVTAQIRAAAEGKLGDTWKTIYWALAGNKRFISVILALLGGALMLAGYAQAGEILGVIAGVGVSLGFVDANWRSEATGETFKDTWWFKILANNSPTITLALGAAYFWLSGSACTLGAWCAWGTSIVLVLGYVFVQLGLIDSAWKAEPPKVA